jgi:hypothetical protein
MRVRLARRYGKSLSFIGVLEFHKSGIAHLHILLGVYIPQQWLSVAWQSIGGGKVVDIRYVDIHRVTAYLACYLTGQKVEQTLFFLPNRARIFTTSRSIVLWGKKKEPSGWWLRRMSLSELRDAVGIAHRERYEFTEDLKRFGLESLTYFEGPIAQVSIGNRDPIAVLKKLIPIWKAGTV